MRIDPECPTDSNATVVTTLKVMAVVYFISSVAGALFCYRSGGQIAADIARVMQPLAQAGPEFSAAFPTEALHSITRFWYGSAIAVLLQGLVVSAILLALSSITESLIGIRISSRTTAQAAHDAKVAAAKS